MAKALTITEKTNKILATARELFNKHGFEKTTIEEIARSAQMSKVTLYAVFSNKEEILFGLCSAHCDHLDAMLEQKAAEARGNYINCMIELMKLMVKSIHNESSSVRTPETLLYISGQVRKLFQKRLEARKKLFSSVLEKAVKNKELPASTDVDQLCEVLLASITAYLPPYNKHLSQFGTANKPKLKTLETELELLTQILAAGTKSLQ
jgi:AcrR family transcriptional regulator